jgi:hypothetical protein
VVEDGFQIRFRYRLCVLWADFWIAFASGCPTEASFISDFAKASIEIHPVMVPADLIEAGGAIVAAVNRYG